MAKKEVQALNSENGFCLDHIFLSAETGFCSDNFIVPQTCFSPSIDKSSITQCLASFSENHNTSRKVIGPLLTCI